jgi:hypothetical protein
MINKLSLRNPWVQTILPASLSIAGWLGLSNISAQAASINFSVPLANGDPIGIGVTLDDTLAGAGKVRATVQVTSGLGDISGVYFDITNSLLNNLTFTPVSFMGASGASNNFISLIDQDGTANNLGNGTNMNGSGQSVFDVGLRIGNSGGINGGDDYQKIVFDIGHTSSSVALSDFANWGVRAKSVLVNTSRNGSSKLSGEVPTTIPAQVAEPSTLLGMALIGGGLKVLRKKQEA